MRYWRPTSALIDDVSVAVNVIDSTPPEVRLTLSVDTLWAPNNKLIPVTVFPDVVDQAGTAVCSSQTDSEVEV